MAEICVFGDSITWGANDKEKGGWVNRLQSQLLKRNGKRRDFTVYNLGVPGDKTKDLLKRFDCESSVREPDVIIFAVGINDSSYLKSKKTNRVPIRDFETNVYKLIRKARSFTKKVVFVGLTVVDEKKTMPILWNKDIYYSNRDINIYNKKLKDICRAHKILYIDVAGTLKTGDLGDGLHLDSRGHEKMFRKIYSFLKYNKWAA